MSHKNHTDSLLQRWMSWVPQKAVIRVSSTPSRPLSLHLENHWSTSPAWRRRSNLTLCYTRDPAAPSTQRTAWSHLDLTTWWATAFPSDTQNPKECNGWFRRFCFYSVGVSCSKVTVKLYLYPCLLGFSQSFSSIAPDAAWTAGGGCETGHRCLLKAEPPEHLHKRFQCSGRGATSGRGASGWVLVHRSYLARLGHFGLEQTQVLHRERGTTA